MLSYPGGRGTYLGWGLPPILTWLGGVLPWDTPCPDLAGGVPTLARGVPTFGYPWPGQGVERVLTLARGNLPWGTPDLPGGYPILILPYLPWPWGRYLPPSGPGRGTPCSLNVNRLKTLPSPILWMRSVTINVLSCVITRGSVTNAKPSPVLSSGSFTAEIEVDNSGRGSFRKHIRQSN